MNGSPETSDGSFAWTDASDDSIIGDAMARNNMNTSQSGEESESGKTYKKKLQNQLLFSGENNDVTKLNGTEANLHRKRKLSQHSSNDENITNSNKKKVKTEACHVNKQKVKKKHRSSEINGQSSLNDPNDESFLDLKVKDEHNFATPSLVKTPRKKKTNDFTVKDTSVSDDCLNMSRQLPSPIESKAIYTNQIQYEEDSSHVEENENQCDTHKKKKKKSKRKREYSDGENSEKDNMITNNYSAEETVVEEYIESELSETPDKQTNGDSLVSDIQNDKIDTRNISLKGNVDTVSKGNRSQNETGVNSSNISDKNTKRKSLSERIKFEDEKDSDVKFKRTKKSRKVKNESKLNSFIESSIHLRPISAKLSSVPLLSDDDDVWVIRCPKEVNVEAFQDKKWVLDNKCKIKLDGRAYEGDADDNKSNITIVSARNGKSIIKNIKVNGYIRLHRRIPKTHIQNDNIMVNNQNNFIPLPETKCRHPLFGSNYKKAIKLPSAVAERLRAPRTEPAGSAGRIKRKKNKRKSQNNTDPAEESLAASSAAPEERAAAAANNEPKARRKHSRSADEPSAPRGKRRKHSRSSDEPSAPRGKRRKHSRSSDEPSAPRGKRRKHDPTPAEVWDSEKAIEENLFNF